MKKPHFVNVTESCRLLLDEKVVAVPTETVYGLAALATSAAAIDKIYRIKKRPADNPLICHFHSFHQAVPFVAPYPIYVDALVERFSPGPVSFLLPLKEHSGLEYAVRGQSNVIVRIPAHPMLLELLTCVRSPLAAPSANTSGKYSATTAQMVADDIGSEVDGILDGGESQSGIESTILNCTHSDRVEILRPASVGAHEIEMCLKKNGFHLPVIYAESKVTTPGSRYKHYAPRTPMTRISSIMQIPADEKNIVVLLSDEALAALPNEVKSEIQVVTLGSEKNPETIAHNLYAALHRLDSRHAKHAFLLYPEIVDDDWRLALYHRLDKITSAG